MKIYFTFSGLMPLYVPLKLESEVWILAFQIQLHFWLLVIAFLHTSSISILVSDDVHQLVYLLIGLSKFDIGVNWVGLGSAAAELKDDWISWL